MKTIAASIALTLLGLTAACSTAPTSATDTMPTNTESARQLAQMVASNGRCGDSFEDYNFNRARDTWVFTCQKAGMSFEIVDYGSKEARFAAIKSLNDHKTPYVIKDFYTVAVMASEGNGSLDSALALFKK